MIPQRMQTEPSESSSSDEVRGVLLTVEEVKHLEPVLKPMLERSLTRYSTGVSTDHFFREAQLGYMQVWVAFDEEEILAVMVTQVLECDGSKFCDVIQLAGRDMHRWIHLMGVLEAWANELGCRTIEIKGRPGWGRIFKDYRETHRVFSKELH